MRLLGNPPQATRDALLSVVDGALSGGSAEPSWLAVDDGDTGWLVSLASVPSAERLRAVAAVSNEESLVAALRLGVGGAVWLPASSLGILEALEAAVSVVGERPCCDPSLIRLLGREPALTLVSFSDSRFWEGRFGSTTLAAMLGRLALDLGVVPAILSWPALLVGGGVGAGDIQSHWQKVVAEEVQAIPGLSLSAMDLGEDDLPAAAYRVLLRGEPDETIPGTTGLLPVHELPGGGRVGSWSIGTGEAADSGWTARPRLVRGELGRWTFVGENDTVIDEVDSTDGVDALEDPVAARVPGWASRDLRPGTPSGLLVTRLAEAAARRSLPLWIPNLSHEGLHFALCLPGTLWVDGPAVPR